MQSTLQTTRRAHVASPLTRSLPYLFSLPTLAMVGFLFLFPILKLVYSSFFVSLQTGGVRFTLSRYISFLSDPFNLSMIWRTIKVSALTTLISLVAAFPVALFIRQVSPRWRTFLSLVMLSPLLMSVVVRTLGWVILLAPRGVVNTALQALGLNPVQLIYNDTAVVMGLTHVYFGYMVLSPMTSVSKMDDNLLLAASNLGANRWQIFRHVILPLSLPGVVAGSILVFSLSASAYVTPALLGGHATKLLATRVYELAIVHLEWEEAATVATILFVVILAGVWVLGQLTESRKRRAMYQ